MAAKVAARAPRSAATCCAAHSAGSQERPAAAGARCAGSGGAAAEAGPGGGAGVAGAGAREEQQFAEILPRPVNVVCWKRAICLEFMEKVSFSASEHLPFFVSIQAHHIWGLWHFRNITNTEIVLAMQADVLEYYDQTVSSPSGSFNIPAVLRVPQLLHVVKRRRVKQSLSRKNIIYRDGFTCQYCSSGENLTIDHVTACSRCNSRKGQKTLEQANMKLLKTPKAPKEYDILAVPLTKRAFRTLKRNQGLPEEWLQYLASPSP
ncbi:hypothetical protein PR202_ga28249 [Eleusine coracana subsp. coracana]|uniref:HNH endonuclease n=1 Tax=Eleusine coracana subsp. coracana TaxID=191504 RepID=A0AAV5DIP9_ELECO|nr:hypothetical protein PR202_ga28249 [Eleusine coracana subsp. coracana]